MKVRLLLGDCVVRMGQLPEGSIDIVCCDPPYGLEFMGQKWDRLEGTVTHDPASIGGYQDGSGGNAYSRSRIRYGTSPGEMGAWHLKWLEAAHRILRPGGVLKAFSSTRTYHRLAVAMEIAGFTDIRLEAWGYGSGFPKSLNVSKALDRLAGVERPVLGVNPNHRPESGVHYEGVYAGGNTGAAEVTGPASEEAKLWAGWGTALKPAWEPVLVGRKEVSTA